MTIAGEEGVNFLMESKFSSTVTGSKTASKQGDVVFTGRREAVQFFVK